MLSSRCALASPSLHLAICPCWRQPAGRWRLKNGSFDVLTWYFDPIQWWYLRGRHCASVKAALKRPCGWPRFRFIVSAWWTGCDMCRAEDDRQAAQPVGRDPVMRWGQPSGGRAEQPRRCKSSSRHAPRLRFSAGVSFGHEPNQGERHARSGAGIHGRLRIGKGVDD